MTKVFIAYSDKSPEETLEVWLKLIVAKDDLQLRLGKLFSLEVGAINERFVLKPAFESSGFGAQIKYNIHINKNSRVCRKMKLMIR